MNEDGELSIDEFVKGCLEDGELMMFTVRYLPLQWYLPVLKRNFYTSGLILSIISHFFLKICFKKDKGISLDPMFDLSVKLSQPWLSVP